MNEFIRCAVRIHRESLGERWMTGLHFLAKGDWVSTVGYDEALIHQYIRNQAALDSGHLASGSVDGTIRFRMYKRGRSAHPAW